MKDLPPPFRFDLSALIQRARQKINTQIDGIAINLPFVTFNIKPDDLERRIAREIVIRMADRRVLNAFECCDSCIDQAIASLHEIRALLVDKQVEMSMLMEAPLYFLIEFMLEAIRQFLTFEQRLSERSRGPSLLVSECGGSHKPRTQHEQYFAALEMLRAHLHRCLIQVAKMANMQIPTIRQHMRYDETWRLEVYERPAMLS